MKGKGKLHLKLNIYLLGDVEAGIYPGQEKELEIQDVYKQYDTLMGYLEQVPEYINIVMIPGNHDAVRRADPQPKLDKSLIKKDYSNVILGSSPSMFKIEQFNVLMYHGNSMDSMIANIPGLSYHNPEYVIVEYLRRRHLGPIFGANHLIPEEKDYLVIILFKHSSLTCSQEWLFGLS